MNADVTKCGGTWRAFSGDICELMFDEITASWSQCAVNCLFQDRYYGYLKHRKNYYYFLTSRFRDIL